MLESHPASELFPLLPDVELAELAADIKTNRLREPIVLFDGKILDGRNRYRACAAAGVTPDVVQWNGECGSPVAYVISVNLKRRHLDVGQRAAIAVEAAKLEEAEAKKRQSAGLKRGAIAVGTNLSQRDRGRSIERAANASGVSASSAKAFKRLKDERPDLAQRVVAGDLTINAAAQMAKADEGADGQKRETGNTPEGVLDELGGKVPQHLRETFKLRADYDNLSNILSQMKRRARQLAALPGGSRLRLNELEISIDNTRNQILFSRPHAVCPECGGNRGTCGTCKKTGFVTSAEWKAIPKREPGDESEPDGEMPATSQPF